MEIPPTVTTTVYALARVNHFRRLISIVSDDLHVHKIAQPSVCGKLSSSDSSLVRGRHRLPYDWEMQSMHCAAGHW